MQGWPSVLTCVWSIDSLSVSSGSIISRSLSRPKLLTTPRNRYFSPYLGRQQLQYYHCSNVRASTVYSTGKHQPCPSDANEPPSFQKGTEATTLARHGLAVDQTVPPKIPWCSRSSNTVLISRASATPHYVASSDRYVTEGGEWARPTLIACTKQPGREQCVLIAVRQHH